MANADPNKARRVALKWALYAVLLAAFAVMAFWVDPRPTMRERFAFTFGAFITLALYSFLFGENEVYRFCEHLIVGIVAATGFAQALEKSFYPYWFQPMREGVKAVFWDHKFDAKVFWVLAPIPGAFWYMIYSKKHLWLSRLVAVFVIGAGIGQGLKMAFANLVSQAGGTFKPLWKAGLLPDNYTWGHVLAAVWFSFSNLVFVVVVLVVLFYFVFTFRAGDHRLGRQMHSVGRIFMMIAFGVVFGTVVGTRMGLVTDRIYFLVEEWAKPITTYWLGG